MTRAEAKAEVQSIWDFKEVDGMIAVRDVTLIRAAERIEADRTAFRDQELVSHDRTPYPTPNS